MKNAGEKKLIHAARQHEHPHLKERLGIVGAKQLQISVAGALSSRPPTCASQRTHAHLERGALAGGRPPPCEPTVCGACARCRAASRILPSRAAGSVDAPALAFTPFDCELQSNLPRELETYSAGLQSVEQGHFCVFLYLAMEVARNS